MAEAPGPRDPTDPSFEPIHGVSLATFAEVSTWLAAGGAADSRSRDMVLRQRGVDAALWTDVVAGWLDRIADDAVVRNAWARHLIRLRGEESPAAMR